MRLASPVLLVLCLTAWYARVSQAGREEDVYQAEQYQAWTGIYCAEPRPVVNTVRVNHGSHVTYTCLEGTQLTSGSLGVSCSSSSYPTCEVNCGEPLRWDDAAEITYKGFDGTTLGGVMEYRCWDLGERVFNTRTCTHSGWTNDAIFCRDESIDLAGGLGLSVMVDGNVQHQTSGCASVDVATGAERWIGVQFNGQTIDLFMIRVYDDPNVQNEIVTSTLTIRLKRGEQVVKETVIQAEGAALSIEGRDIDGVWLTYPGMQTICAIKIYGQRHYGGCANLFPPYPAVVESSTATTAHLACQAGLVYAGDGQNLGPGAEYNFYTTVNVDGIYSSQEAESSGTIPNSGDIIFELPAGTAESTLIVDLQGTFVIDRIVLGVDGAEVQRVLAATEELETVSECQKGSTSLADGSPKVFVCNYQPQAHALVITLAVHDAAGSNALHTSIAGSNTPATGVQTESGISQFSDLSTSSSPNHLSYEGEGGSPYLGGNHDGWARRKRNAEDSTTVNVTDLNIVGSSTLNGVLECYKSDDGRDYQGRLNVSSLGQECLSWDENAAVLGITDDDFPDLGIEEAQNFCRIVSVGVGDHVPPRLAFSISTDESEVFEKKTLVRYKSGHSVVLYFALRPWTTEGIPFVNSDEFPEGDRNHSYCRNPARSQSRPWCYINPTQSELCVVPRCPIDEGHFLSFKSKYGDIFIAWLWASIQGGGQVHCYRLEYDKETPSLVEMYLSDLTSACQGVDPIVTMVCSWTTVLYQEDDALWYHVIVDCASSTASLSQSTGPSLNPTSVDISTPPPESTSGPPSDQTVSTSEHTVAPTTPASNTQPPASSTPSMKLCPCDCAWKADLVYSDAEVQALVDKITKELSVPQKNLSSTVRAKTCAEDNRQSAVGTGVVGLVLTGLVGTIIFSLDVLGLLKHLCRP
ncbi:hypothetical protein EGW08_005586 [Elysia chlorotica]|uniref:Kringle domain-containing protein n=1 Tax=Elysia chlorotica TaxID=188477 RepID=A0A3S1C9K3_ELYCH|nr:hypothetical protein EGW08_005586 [Elysia chlorotica]